MSRKAHFGAPKATTMGALICSLVPTLPIPVVGLWRRKHIGSPYLPEIGCLLVGKFESIESNGREQETARKGRSVAIKIVNESNPTTTYSRQFDASNMLYSQLSRASIHSLKAHFNEQ
jgi:hypothetical protein